jgi:two-component system, OmpR family, phosphate regulon sensor histidine kinase PhoR
MSRRSMFLASAFIAAALSAFIIISLWYPAAALFGLCAALVGAIAASLLSSRNNHDDPERQSVSVPVAGRAEAAFGKAWPALSPGLLLDATINSMREGMLVVDDSMRVVSFNRAAREIFKAAEGRTESPRLTEVTRNPFVHKAFRAALQHGERAEVKVEVNGRERRTFDLRVAPLLSIGNNGQSIALGIFFDITRLERLERVRQEFLSNVSHELRTPLTAIIAFIETLEDGAIEDPAANRRFLSVIRKNAARMHNLIDDILELSAIEARTVKVEPQPVALFSLIEDITTALATQARSREVAVRNEVWPGTVVHADGRRLEQMLTNLIDNAIKFNREGGTVWIRHTEMGERDRISVTNTGEGIPAEHLPRIFERFYRVDRARSREMGGTGLGLAIVKHLARAHGGEATVQSELGAQTTFTIELPQPAQKAQ